jgi:hypothetical protein
MRKQLYFRGYTTQGGFTKGKHTIPMKPLEWNESAGINEGVWSKRASNRKALLLVADKEISVNRVAT